MSRYLIPDHEAHKLAALHYTSANEVALRNELKYYRARAEEAEKHLRMFYDVSDNLVKLAMLVPDEEMTPFVHQTIFSIEEAKRYISS